MRPGLRRLALIWLSTALLAAAVPHPLDAAAEPDAIDEALSLVGMTRSDLGFEPRGWWERFPEDIPYKLRHFDDLQAEPMAIIPFTRVLGANLRLVLAPELVAGREGNRGAHALYRAVHDMAINKRFGASRAYSANLSAPLTPLREAITQAWTAEGRATSFATFGNRPEHSVLDSELKQACEAVPPEVGSIVGKLVLDLLEARRWSKLAWRNVDLETRTRLAARVDLRLEVSDAEEYEPAVDDAAHSWDEASLWYAGSKTVEAVDLARLALADTLADVADRGALAKLRFSFDTPVGRIVVLGTGSDELNVPQSGAFLVVDLGGDDRYFGPIAASNPNLPVAAALDLDGNDQYRAQSPAQGAGVIGIGVLLDVAGRDEYHAHDLAQGSGHFGLGALLDLAGDDVYDMHFSGQGAGCFGVGALFDIAGRDQYTVWGDGQGYGSVGGVGVLADRVGDDVYLAVTDPKITGRPSPHAENKLSASGAQGCGMGRRGDGADGHSWAGGLGALLDAEGNDQYTAADWAQGCGYWFGTGLVWDGAGDDQFHANGWASASGAHFCIGAVIDEAGNDTHDVKQNWGPAYGHDFTTSVFYEGGGDDAWICGAEGVGHSINRSVALCFEAGGNDVYSFSMAAKHPGLTSYDKRFIDRNTLSVYWTESTSLGLFVDTGGTDRYPEGFHDDMTWTDDPASDNAKARNFGVFVDRPSGTLDIDRPIGGKRR